MIPLAATPFARITISEIDNENKQGCSVVASRNREVAVTQMVSRERLGSAYGGFGAAFGVAWFAGSAALGALYDASVAATMALAVIAQSLAVISISIATRRKQSH